MGTGRDRVLGSTFSGPVRKTGDDRYVRELGGQPRHAALEAADLARRSPRPLREDGDAAALGADDASSPPAGPLAVLPRTIHTGRRGTRRAGARPGTWRSTRKPPRGACARRCRSGRTWKSRRMSRWLLWFATRMKRSRPARCSTLHVDAEKGLEDGSEDEEVDEGGNRRQMPPPAMSVGIQEMPEVVEATGPASRRLHGVDDSPRPGWRLSCRCPVGLRWSMGGIRSATRTGIKTARICVGPPPGSPSRSAPPEQGRRWPGPARDLKGDALPRLAVPGLEEPGEDRRSPRPPRGGWRSTEYKRRYPMCPMQSARRKGPGPGRRRRGRCFRVPPADGDGDGDRQEPVQRDRDDEHPVPVGLDEPEHEGDGEIGGEQSHRSSMRRSTRVKNSRSARKVSAARTRGHGERDERRQPGRGGTPTGRTRS